MNKNGKLKQVEYITLRVGEGEFLPSHPSSYSQCQLLHISSLRLVSIANVMLLKRCQHHVFGGTFLWTDR